MAAPAPDPARRFVAVGLGAVAVLSACIAATLAGGNSGPASANAIAAHTAKPLDPAGPGSANGLASGAATTMAPAPSSPNPGLFTPVPTGAPPAPPEPATTPLQYPFYPYDGSITFVRIQTRGYYGRGRRGGWSHDYPDAEINLFRIVDEITSVPVRLAPTGGNVLTFDDPRLTQFPMAYVSEPGDWQTSPEESAALRKYLLRGGFVIFDDFFTFEMDNLRRQMKQAFPELEFQPMDGSEPIWNTYFSIDPLTIDLQGPQKNGTPTFFALYEDNDPIKRLLAIANAGADVGDLWEWAAEGLFPVDPTNVAFQIGVNYLMYALTH